MKFDVKSSFRELPATNSFNFAEGHGVSQHFGNELALQVRYLHVFPAMSQFIFTPIYYSLLGAFKLAEI